MDWRCGVADLGRRPVGDVDGAAGHGSDDRGPETNGRMVGMIEGQQPPTRRPAEHLVSGIAADAETPIPADDDETGFPAVVFSEAVAEAAVDESVTVISSTFMADCFAVASQCS